VQTGSSPAVGREGGEVDACIALRDEVGDRLCAEWAALPTPTVDAVHKLLGRNAIGRTLTLRVLRAGKTIEM
jgi:hypothetical protein